VVIGIRATFSVDSRRGASRVGESVYIVWANTPLNINLKPQIALNVHRVCRMSKMTQEADWTRPKLPRIRGGIARIPISTWVGLMVPDGALISPSVPRVPDWSRGCIYGGQGVVILETGFQPSLPVIVL
jgi:hypothetical protein